MGIGGRLTALYLVIAGVGATAQARDQKPDFEKLLPDGYQVDKTIRHDFSGEGYAQYVVAVSDHINLEQPLILLYLERDGAWIVKDKALVHARGERGSDASFEQPNYFGDLALEKTGSGPLILLRSVASSGGSGAAFFFDLYQVREGRLVLLRTFRHGRMEQTYFCLDKGDVYDAAFVDIRGPKVGRSFVHTYYLEVTRYAFDGVGVVAVGRERLREKQGNWTRADDYRFVSVCRALRSGEIFR
jgi:hypothetical protein